MKDFLKKFNAHKKQSLVFRCCIENTSILVKCICLGISFLLILCVVLVAFFEQSYTLSKDLNSIFMPFFMLLIWYFFTQLTGYNGPKYTIDAYHKAVDNIKKLGKIDGELLKKLSHTYCTMKGVQMATDDMRIDWNEQTLCSACNGIDYRVVVIDGRNFVKPTWGTIIKATGSG